MLKGSCNCRADFQHVKMEVVVVQKILHRLQVYKIVQWNLSCKTASLAVKMRSLKTGGLWWHTRLHWNAWSSAGDMWSFNVCVCVGGGFFLCVCVTVQLCFTMCLCLYLYYLYMYMCVFSAIKKKYVVFQDRWSYTAVVSQDRFHCNPKVYSRCAIPVPCIREKPLFSKQG